MISDVHYNINTLEVADKAMRIAVYKANELKVPLIVAGDLHDTKANMRGECVKAMLNTISLCKITPYILVGNHCKINEKSKEHALEFLRDKAIIVDEPMDMPLTGSHGIPYYSDAEELHSYIKKVPKGARLIMHQGVVGSRAGHYIQDKSACPSEWFANYRVISGHYHERQDIKCGRPQKGCVGLWSYLGNPYTLNFSEANISKGYNILKDDGTLEFVPLELRRHRIITCGWDDKHGIFWGPILKGKPDDLVWVKVEGTREQLSQVTKKWLIEQGYETFKDGNFKLDLVPLDIKSNIDMKSTSTQSEVLDEIIGSLSNVSDEQKKRLKTLWKDLIE